MKILAVNSGSSSLKYQLFAMPEARVLASGAVEKIGEHESMLRHRFRNASGQFEELRSEQAVPDHSQALEAISAALRRTDSLNDPNELDGIGHRVVHGGTRFHQATLIDGEVVEGIRQLIPLAPLHNPPSLKGIEIALQAVPQVPQVAVFDTAFHQTMPPHAFYYALPLDLQTRHGVRRYGFHGISYRYVTRQTANLLGRPLAELNLIVMHLGNGASATAIAGGQSIDTSMGMTPLEGLIMGTRCGDLDPAIPFYLVRKTGMSSDALEAILNHQSGLKGLGGVNDMREIHRRAEAGQEGAQLALEMYSYRLKKYIGAYLAVLGRVDALVFTGGIGENDVQMRLQACTGLENLGIRLDAERNQQVSENARELQAEGAAVKILVVPTNEELEIANQTVECIEAAQSGEC